MSEGHLPGLPRLDARLACIASLVPKCELAADIGADHGKLSCWLLGTGRVQRMTVSDISKPSRDKARDLFIEHGLMDRVRISGQDGLHALDGHEQAVIIAGMGGGLIVDMLRQDVDLKADSLVLSAHTELPQLRTAILGRGYKIMEEVLVNSGGRYYRVISAVPGQQQLSAAQLELGYGLRAENGTSLVDYYRWQLAVTQEWQGERGTSYRKLLQEALDEHKQDDSPPGV